jgi:TIR domain
MNAASQVMTAAGPQRFAPPARDMPNNAVFLSYARDDLAAVQRIKAGLDAAGITTWFDMERLEGGDDYDRKIQRNIARCSFSCHAATWQSQRGNPKCHAEPGR